MNQTAKLYTALIIILGLAAGYLYYSQVIVTSEVPVPAAPISANDSLRQFTDLKIDFGILDDAHYKKLTINGEMPVQPGVTGKKDIFAP